MVMKNRSAKHSESGIAVFTKADRLQAERVEEKASPTRRKEADAYTELARRGLTQHRIAEACETTQSTASRFVACTELYALGHHRPSFWTAYQEIKAPKTAHASHDSGQNEW